MPSVNRLQYNGTVSKPVLITAYVEYSTASVSTSNVWFAIYQNGNLINQSISPSICPVGSTVNTSINCISIANPTDYFELWLNDQTSAVAITVSSVSLSIK
jgi:ABC-type polysaccharide/polyol phosphate export permease